MVKKIPDRWEAYSPIGMQIPGTRIISFKVPLKENVANQLPPQKRLSIPILLEKVPDLGLVIDLTMTTKYYNKNDLLARGVSYAKIACPGQQLPNDSLVARFFSAIDTFLESHSNDNTLIGVHCTHGVNRTGYLIARYLIEKLGFSSQDAIELVGKMRGHPIERAPYTKSLFRCTPIRFTRGIPRSKDIEEPSRPISEFWPHKDTGSGKDIVKLERGQAFGKRDIEQGRVKSWDKHQPSTSRGHRAGSIPGRFEDPEVYRPMRMKEDIAFEKQYHPRQEVHVDAPRVEKATRDYPHNEVYPYIREEMPKHQEYSRHQYREEKTHRERSERYERHHDYPRGRSPIEEFSKPPEKHRDLVYHRAIREEIRIDYAPPVHREKDAYPDKEYERSYEFNRKDPSYTPHNRYMEKEIHHDRHFERERKEDIRSDPRHFDGNYERDDFHSNFKTHSFRDRSPERVLPESKTKNYEPSYDGLGDGDRRRNVDRGYPKHHKPEIEDRKYWSREDEIRNKRSDNERPFPDEFRGRDSRRFDSGRGDRIQFDDHQRNQRVSEERHFPSGSSFHGDRNRAFDDKRHERRNFDHPERKRDFVEPDRERYENFRPEERSERNVPRRNYSPEKRFEKPFHSSDYHLRDEYADHRDFKPEARRISPDFPPHEEIFDKGRRSPDIRTRPDRHEKDFLPENFRRDDRRPSHRERHWKSIEKAIPPRRKSEERPLRSPDRFSRSREIIEAPDFPVRSRSRDIISRERILPVPKSNNGDLREEIRLKRTHRELSLGHDRRTQSPLNRGPRMSTEERDCRELINMKRGGNFPESEIPNWSKRDRPENQTWEEPPRKRFRQSPAENEGSPRWKHKPLESGSRRKADWVPKGRQNVRAHASPIPRNSHRGRGRGSRSSGKQKVFDRLKRKPWE